MIFQNLSRVIVVVSLLMVADRANAQATLGTIPECVSAWNTLVAKSQTKNAATLVKTNCETTYYNKWLSGTGVTNAAVCKPAFDALNAAGVLPAVKELVTRNCPIMYKEGWRTDPAKAPVIPQCVASWDAIVKVNQLQSAEVLIKTNCETMYYNKWLNGSGVTNVAVCKPAFDKLSAASALPMTRDLVTRNCPVLYQKGWIKP